MSGDNGYNGGPVEVRQRGWYSRISKRNHEQILGLRCRGVDHSGRQPYSHGPVHVKTAEIAEYLNSHTSGVLFFRAARAQTEKAQTVLDLMRIMNLTEEERHAEIEGVLAEDYQPDRAISIDPKKLEHTLDNQRPQYHWFRRDAS